MAPVKFSSMLKKLLLGLFLAISLYPSRGQQGFPPNSIYACLAGLREARVPVISAHRGGRFIAGYPENALETFDYTLRQAPAFIECDVNMTRDSVLILMHDRTLNRTTTGRGSLDSTGWESIRELYLVDDYGRETPFRIPHLEEVLQWCKGRAVLTLDVKRGVPFSRVISAIEAAGAGDYAVLITYSLEGALEAHRLAPELVISATIRNEEELGQYLDSGIPPEKLMAFTGVQARSAGFYEKLRQNGIPAIIGTMGNLDAKAMARGPRVYQALFQAGAGVFATDRPAEVFDAFRKAGR